MKKMITVKPKSGGIRSNLGYHRISLEVRRQLAEGGEIKIDSRFLKFLIRGSYEIIEKVEVEEEPSVEESPEEEFPETEPGGVDLERREFPGLEEESEKIEEGQEGSGFEKVEPPKPRYKRRMTKSKDATHRRASTTRTSKT